jgi:hypothetical protein
VTIKSVALKMVLAAALGLPLAACAGGRMNDTGGIIPWSPENERMAPEIAQVECARYGKNAVRSSIRRMYGDYIAYRCVFAPPLQRHGRG